MATLTSMNIGTEIPGPFPVPALGGLPTLLRFAFNPLSALEGLHDTYGDIVRLRSGKDPAIIVFHPSYNREILRDPSVFHSYNLDFLPIPFPKDSSIARVMTSMPFLNGEKHNAHRAYLLPYFHRNFITRFHDACVDVTKRKLDSWQAGRQVDLRSEMEQLAMWLAAKPILGLDPEMDGEAVGRRLEHSMKLLFSPLTLLFPYDIPGLPFHRLLKSAERLEQAVREVIKRRKARGSYGEDILSALIQLHEQRPEKLSEADIVGQTIMFRGGYSPNGMALYWTLFLLSQHPQALMNVLDELAQVLRGESPTPEQLESLPQLESAIKETMRLFPAGILTARYSMESFELGPYRLPKGTWILLSAYITQRTTEIFPDPYRFLPERWSSIHPSAYEFMAFSGGPRYCIGTSLAMMQLKIALSMILQRYTLTLKPGTVVDYVGLNAIRPKNGLPMIVNSYDVPPVKASFKGNVHRIVDFN